MKYPQLNINSLTVLTIVLLIFSYIAVWAHNDSKDLVLSSAEYTAIQKFKPLVWNHLKEPFMKSDFYLIRWLRRTKLDVSRARLDLLDAISWRAKNNMSRIVSEDWSDLAPDYTMSFDGHDKIVRPVQCIDMGEWDLRAASIHGIMPRLRRYLLYFSEKARQRVFQAQQEGKNVTRFVVLVNADGFNILQHGCPSCTLLVVQWVVESTSAYPDFTNELIIFNMPPFGTHLLNAIRAVASPDVRNQIKAFDSNKHTWMKYLDGQIDRSERSPSYGGTKTT